MYFVFLCFYKNAINITNKKKRNISLAKIDVSYILSISKKRYVAISGKMSKNFTKIQQKYEKAPLF